MADNLGQQKQENEMFVYSVSHDLRSPLVNLQGFSEELSLSCRDLRELFRRDDVPEPVRRRGLQLMDRDIEESIRFIQAAVGRLARIIDALLRLSRAGRVEYQWQEVNLAAAVGKIVDGPARLHHRQGGRGRGRRPAAGLGRPDGPGAGLRQPDRQRRAVPRSRPAR